MDIKKGAIGPFFYVNQCNSSSEVVRHEVPVDQVPEVLDVLGTGIAVVDVVGVLPHVAGQQRGLAGGQGATGVAGIDDLQAAVAVLHQKLPKITVTVY